MIYTHVLNRPGMGAVSPLDDGRHAAELPAAPYAAMRLSTRPALMSRT